MTCDCPPSSARAPHSRSPAAPWKTCQRGTLLSWQHLNVGIAWHKQVDIIHVKVCMVPLAAVSMTALTVLERRPSMRF